MGISPYCYYRMILRSTCAVIWTGLLLSTTIDSVIGESEPEKPSTKEDACLATDEKGGKNCPGRFGFDFEIDGDKTQRRNGTNYDNLKDLDSKFTDSGTTVDDKAGIHKGVGGKAIKEVNKANKFRNSGKDYKVPQKAAGKSVYEYKEQLGGEPLGCGHPICVEVDMVPKRFTSMCAFAKWMKETRQLNRVFMVQKQDCADIIDQQTNYKQNKKKRWAINMGKKGAQAKCLEHEGCNTKICINDDGTAKTFANVYKAMQYIKKGLGNPKEKTQEEKLKDINIMRNRQVIAVGLGECSDLYLKGCINTEWFDLDDPVSDGVEEESVPGAHQLVISSDPEKMETRFTKKGKEVVMQDQASEEQGKDDEDGKDKNVGADGLEIWSEDDRPHRGIHRSCHPKNIDGDAEFRTTCTDEAHIPIGQPGNYNAERKLLIKCKSHQNKLPLEKKSSWDMVKKNVTCHDWKLRYCCKEMWGEAESFGELILVDKPERKELFEGCSWKQFISFPRQDHGDNEGKQMYTNNQIQKIGKEAKPANVCKGYALGTRFIDVRTNDGNSTPFDEFIMAHENSTKVEEDVLKISAAYGFICRGKGCKDYKVKYCCNKDPSKIKTGTWGKWSPWSTCDSECEGGKQKRTRKCNDGEDKCFSTMENPKEQTKPCNEDKPCSGGGTGVRSLNLWSQWSTCSVSCGNGIQYSRRCKGTKCDEKESMDKPCRVQKCPKHEWGNWSPWAGCRAKCDKASSAIRQRKCLDKNYQNKISDYDMCEGGEKGSMEKGGKCPAPTRCKQDGKWSKWSDWGFCNEFCQKTRRRYCDNPPQQGTGKACEGPSEEAKECKDPPKGTKCPEKGKEPCRFSDWGEWGPCSLFCGDIATAHDHTRTRYRHVMSKNVEKCKKKEGIILEHAEQCLHCDELAKKNIANAEEYSAMKKTCIHNCPVDCAYGPWSQWGPAEGKAPCVPCKEPGKKYAEGTNQERTRDIAEEPKYGGKACEKKLQKESEPCPKGDCGDFGAWTCWTACKSDGNYQSINGVQERSRSCKSGKRCSKKSETDTKKGCIYLRKGTDPYEQWTEWSKCSTEGKEANGESCGKGKQERSRKCKKFIDGKEKAVKKILQIW